MRYHHATLDGGWSGSREIVARTMREAWAIALEWAAEQAVKSGEPVRLELEDSETGELRSEWVEDEEGEP